VKQCRIVIADDHSIVREGLKGLIQKEPQLSIVGEAENGEELLAVLDTLPSDLVVMDIAMPKMDGLTALKEIKHKHPKIKVLIFSMLKDFEHFEHARLHGALGYLAKDDAGEELLKAIKMVRRGKKYVSPSVTTVLAGRQMRSLESGDSPSLEILTKREKQILQLVATGMPNKNIAAALHISIHTVENHRANLSNKLGLKNTASLVKYALAKGLV
jgi:two-component system, NarL family, response regulator NreC